MNEYRCTRNSPYYSFNCPGHLDVRSRQGYYIVAKSRTAAIEEMKMMFPNDIGGFTAELWKENVGRR